VKHTIIIAALLLAGCEKQHDYSTDIVIDQCLRIKLAQQCMKELPKGPSHVGTSNDWDEVVHQCDQNAISQSKRRRKFVAEECAL
jgi:hypothetical protein